ncbi:hypothetical protein ACE1OC_00145 [Streptomyces sp. DSM 116496]|uniref:hypothetical protein n=1 Tax=Streptomyces stoeckheimensis TaxID=3344656 RepID=UPI0038B3E3FC
MPLGPVGAPAPARFPARVPAYAGAVLALAAGLAGCSGGAEARDYGPAPSLSAPATVSALWPDRAETAGADRRDPSGDSRLPVPGVTVPPGGVRELDGAAVLAADPGTEAAVKAGLRGCPGAGCRLRPPEYADLTDSGRPGLVLAYDDPDRTLMWVYAPEADTPSPPPRTGWRASRPSTNTNPTCCSWT